MQFDQRPENHHLYWNIYLINKYNANSLKKKKITILTYKRKIQACNLFVALKKKKVSVQNYCYPYPPPLSCLQFSLADGARFGGSCLIHGPPLPPLPLHTECEDLSVSGEAGIEEVKSPVLRSPPAFSHSRCPPEIHKSCICVRFIAEHTKMLEDSTKVISIDRLLIKNFTKSKIDVEDEDNCNNWIEVSKWTKRNLVTRITTKEILFKKKGKLEEKVGVDVART